MTVQTADSWRAKDGISLTALVTRAPLICWHGVTFDRWRLDEQIGFRNQLGFKRQLMSLTRDEKQFQLIGARAATPKVAGPPS